MNKFFLQYAYISLILFSLLFTCFSSFPLQPHFKCIFFGPLLGILISQSSFSLIFASFTSTFSVGRRLILSVYFYFFHNSFIPVRINRTADGRTASNNFLKINPEARKFFTYYENYIPFGIYVDRREEHFFNF